jgi:sulfate permease, SulP family
MSRRERFRLDPRDAVAGVSVALVVVPQSLAYAQLAGLPPGRGLYAASVPPLAAAPFGSSPYLQPGPTAVSALLTFGALSPLAAVGSPRYIELAALLALMVGVIRVVVGLLHAGVIAYLMSQPLLMGFVPAAALLIIGSQLPQALGAPTHGHHILWQAGWALAHPGQWRADATVIAIVAAALLVLSPRLHRLIPGVLLVAVGAIAYSRIAGYAGAKVGSVHAGLPPLTDSLPLHSTPELVVPALVIALIGFVEASSIARTYATLDRKPWNANREFLSQGVANLAAGTFGGFPVGASFSRSALNRLAGARTTASGLITGLVVLLFLPFGFLVSPLPQSVLAATVLVAVVPLVRWRPFVEVFRASRIQFSITITTFILTLALSPHVERAVIAGAILSVVIHLWRELRLDVYTSREGDVLNLRPSGVLWYGTAQKLDDRFIDLLAQNPDAQRLDIHLLRLGRIDLTGALALKKVISDAKRAGLTVEVGPVPAVAAPLLGRVLPETAIVDPLAAPDERVR